MTIFFKNFFGNMKFAGLLVILTGRFTRAERATFRRIKEGRIGKTNLSLYTDYVFREITLKYGVCGLKIFVARKRPFVKKLW